MVYQPEVVKDKLPVTIGHQYATVALGWEPEAGVSRSWALPLLSERVATVRDKDMVGADQIGMLLRDEKLPFGRELTVEVGDTSDSKPEYLYAHSRFLNLVTVARVRGNRTCSHQYVPTEEEKEPPGGGHPTWYGERCALADPQTWTEPAETHTLWETRRRGKRHRVAAIRRLTQPLVLFQVYHNFVLPHASLRLPLLVPEPTKGSGSAKLWQPRTPAMAAGLTDRVWSLREVLLFRVPPWPQPQTV